MLTLKGGIAILLGCVCSLLYISRQKRRQQARAQKRSPANNKFPGSNQPPNALNPAYPPHYFNPSHLYPQTQAQGPLGAPHGIPEWSQVPPQLNGGSAFAGMQVQYDLAQQYPEAYLEHFRQQGKQTQFTPKNTDLLPKILPARREIYKRASFFSQA